MRTLIAIMLLAANSAFAATSQQPNPDRLKTIEPVKAAPATSKPLIVSPRGCASSCIKMAGGGPTTVKDEPIKPQPHQAAPRPVIVSPIHCDGGCPRVAGGEPPTVVDFGTGRHG